jgi:hypothetical protein
MSELAGVLYLAVILLGMAFLIAWIILPFAIIGTKRLLRELIAETQATNALLNSLLNSRAQLTGIRATRDITKVA